MKKILILHRSDLFGLADDLPLEKLVIEHFNIGLQEVANAAFIAFEDKDLLKILKNDKGDCGTTTVNEFLEKVPQLIDLINPRPFYSVEYDPVSKEIIDPNKGAGFYIGPVIGHSAWPVNITGSHNTVIGDDGTRVPIASGEIAFHYGEQMNANGMIVGVNPNIFSKNPFIVKEQPKQLNKLNPRPQFHIGYDPALKGQIDPVIGIYAKDPNDPNGPFYQLRNYDANDFHKEAMELSKYYNVTIENDFSGKIDNEVKYIARMPDNVKKIGAIGFPTSLREAILYFNPKFDNVFKIMFQHSEIYFTSTLRISYPELYAEIKKECGLWCKDTPLFKDLLTYGCKHEDCMINIILKAIYRFRNFGRDRSGDISAVIEEAKPK